MSGVVRSEVFRRSYRDSVELMGIAEDVKRLEGVLQAGLVMGTAANCAVLADAGLFDGPARDAGPNDLVVAVSAVDDAVAEKALALASRLLAAETVTRPADAQRFVPTTIAEALGEAPGLDLVMISTPGDYAAAEALKALKRGLHVFLFSDNVALADEIALKALARSKGLLLMGPDCGTAILDGVPLGFANAVRRGRIGLVAASGTGLQEVTCLVDQLGEGVSQAIGVGGRDLDAAVGGTMMVAGIEFLADDPGTRVIVLISKPPAPEVAARVLAAAVSSGKPVVAAFLGGDAAAARASGAIPAATLEEAAVGAVDAAQRASSLGHGSAVRPARHLGLIRPIRAEPGATFRQLPSDQRSIRGLYSGGTLASEAKVVLKRALGPEAAAEHTILDLGDDQYTVGRPHPMIDPTLRNEYIVDAAKDRSVGVVLLDVVLGYGAHPDPAGALRPAVQSARSVAARAGRDLFFIGSVCGTDADPQGLSEQERVLTEAGVRLFRSNARAAESAAAVVRTAVPAAEAVS